jgi:hypothetical protein
LKRRSPFTVHRLAFGGGFEGRLADTANWERQTSNDSVGGAILIALNSSYFGDRTLDRSIAPWKFGATTFDVSE